MKSPSPRGPLFALAGVAAAGTLALSLARSQPAPSGAPAASAAPAPSAPDSSAEKPIDFEPIPDAGDKPKPPTPAEWQSATPVRFTRKGPRAKGCRMLRAREWVRVHCDGQVTAVALMGGAANGAFFWVPEAKAGEPAPTQAEITFPLRRGDRRVFELFSFGPAYGGSMISPGLVLQEHWLEGDPAPTIVIR